RQLSPPQDKTIFVPRVGLASRFSLLRESRDQRRRIKQNYNGSASRDGVAVSLCDPAELFRST
ncbi:MAG TPA: hypothetical protein VGQ54_11540, partial [Burkholderiales bacterium]|nr:hypothetical protein [Burkholderiales bacterium]